MFRMRMRLGILVIVVAGLLAGVSCNLDGPRHSSVLPPPIEFDLDSIRARGKLVVLTENSASTYFLYRGQERGFDYELVKAFAKHLGVRLEVKLLDDVDKMFEMLNTGKGDLIASNLTVTAERKRQVRFSDPIYQTRQMLVQRKVEQTDSLSLYPIRDTMNLPDIPIYVHKYSSFYTRLLELERNINKPLSIHEAPGELSTDDLIRLTASGELMATITDENLAMLHADDYPELDMSLAVSDKQDIAWAFRSNSPQLAEELNNWLARNGTQQKITRMYKKYFGDPAAGDYRGPVVLPVLGPNQISVYDSLFRMYAPEIGWDWRLLAALVYQESRFNPRAESWSGAFGLMQLMPETARKFGCDTNQTEEPNIRAGVKYIRHLDRFWKDKVRDPEERLKFVLASYNIGPGHILDARNIARELGMSDTTWDQHVAECLLLKSQEKYYSLPVVKHGYCNSREPYHFVRKILAVFEHYKTNGNYQ